MRSNQNRIKAIAIHLPQFHPFPENDQWWGKGFTEWTNVTKAKPLFPNHYQPQLPSDLGFYDLRLEEARLAQIELAKQYGIFGFCYYHYWFNGKRLMHSPLDRMLQNPNENFPFMLCWANENWSRRWDGEEHELLIKQEYSDDDDVAHFNFLCENFFKDNRYIKIDGRPVFAVYKAYFIKDLKGFIKRGRQVAEACGLPGIYFLCLDNFIERPAEEFGFDGAIHFQPDFRYFQRDLGNLFSRILHKLKIKKSVKYLHHFEQYEHYVSRNLKENKTISANVFPGITPAWDNTARRKQGGLILHESTPAIFEKWLRHIISTEQNKEFLFINAWNEWAEGNHLEPCQKWGTAYLEIIKKYFKR